MVAVVEPPISVHEEHHAPRHQTLIGKYLFSTDHKHIGINYMVTAFIIIILAASSTLSAINFLVTTINMRCRGLRLTRLPLFVWAVLATSAMVLVATPALAGGVGVLLLARVFGVPFFDPAKGGNVILWQHMFWVYSHPAVYIMILPGFGVISEIIPVFSRKPIFGYKSIAFSSVSIALLGFLVWAHH